MISSNTEQRSKTSQTDPRIKAAARKCAAQIKASAEAHDAQIQAAYREYQQAVAQIEAEGSGVQN